VRETPRDCSGAWSAVTVCVAKEGLSGFMDVDVRTFVFVKCIAVHAIGGH